MSIILRHKRRFTVLALLLFSIAGLSWYYFSTKAVTEHVQASESGQAGSYSKIIASHHKYYNKTLCFHADTNIDWPAQEAHARQLISSIKTLQVKDEKIANDLNNVKGLAQKVLEKNDKTSLLYLHRIFHDLDKSVNHYHQKDSFGYTYTGTGKRWFGGGVNKVEDYIAKN